MEQQKATRRVIPVSECGKARAQYGEMRETSVQLSVDGSYVAFDREHLADAIEALTDMRVQLDEADANPPLVKLGPGGDFTRDYTPNEHKRALTNLARDIDESDEPESAIDRDDRLTHARIDDEAARECRGEST